MNSKKMERIVENLWMEAHRLGKLCQRNPTEFTARRWVGACDYAQRQMDELNERMYIDLADAYDHDYGKDD